MADLVHCDLNVLKEFLPSKDEVETKILQLLDENEMGSAMTRLARMMFAAYYDEKFEECERNCDWILDKTWEKLNTGHWKDISLTWRYLYTVATLYKTVVMTREAKESVKQILGVCDMGLLMGAPMLDNVLARLASAINKYTHCQEKTTKRVTDHSSEGSNKKYSKARSYPAIDYEHRIQRISEPPLEYFNDHFVKLTNPVIITDDVEYWPAFSTRKWSLDYIKKIAGNRTVPIELGSKYTDDSWSQQLMTVAEFIEKHIENEDETIGYLAQHQLFDQIPELSEDILTPTYCALGESSFVDINAWFGPPGTVSPLHQDPKHNFLVQVIGEKYIRLYEDKYTKDLAPHDSHILFNTSEIDVENPDLTRYPNFADLPYKECILKPGEMLYIPPRCWHYVRALSVSFSVSFWWE